MTQHAPSSPTSPAKSPKRTHSANVHAKSPSPRSSLKTKPLGPRSPSTNSETRSLPSLSLNVDRDRPGSSRTSLYTSKTPKTSKSTSVLGMEISDAPDDIADETHPPYRPPEAVIEPSEELPGYTGVVEEEEDDIIPVSPLREAQDLRNDAGINKWQSGVRFGLDTEDVVDRPQIGPGIFPRRWLQLVHEHELLQPQILNLPARKAEQAPPEPLVPTTTGGSIAPSLPDYGQISTVEDVWDACPGGREKHGEWWFCSTCWGWIRIVVGHGAVEVEDMEQWEAVIWSTLQAGESYPGIPAVSDIPAARLKRRAEYNRFNDLRTSVHTAQKVQHHLHEFTTLTTPSREKRIERVESVHNAFPHLTVGLVNSDWEKMVEPTHPPRLFVSCSSDLWIQVDEGMIPGQIPMGLAKEFTSERYSNPAVGISGNQSVAEGWNALTILLGNALFKGQRGWVGLNNPKYQKLLGISEVISVMLYYIGFACRQEPDTLRVGPYTKGEHVSVSVAQQMDRYMLRAWLEMQIYVTAYRSRMDVTPGAPGHIAVKHLDLPEFGSQFFNGYPAAAWDACRLLGVTKHDTADTIEKAYDMQISCDAENTSKYLAALQVISDQQVAGKEGLQMKLVLERSMGKYTLSDISAAYAKIGYDDAYAEVICVSADDAPDNHIFEMHKKATQAAANQTERNELSQALALIGKHRGSAEMRRMGESGQTMMSVEDAYAALSAPRDAVDDGLIMQYEMAVNDYPGKTDHYRLCLTLIADAEGEERPGIKKFLSGAVEQPRRDIPVGLQNIGNTCYLNSILQYLYSIRPLRDAVLNYTDSPKPAERSQRFVKQLRLLFLQLYQSEQTAVRPDEELAYLAITRPEVDAIVEPLTIDTIPNAPMTIDSIPDIPSPSSTRVATPTPPSSPTFLSPVMTPTESRSVLGKRQSQDRDSFSDTGERARHKSEGVVPDPFSEDLEMPKSPSAATDLADLSLVTPIDEEEPPIPPEPMYPPPSIPPPLPARPLARRGSTLASGLKFGLQQDSAEVLINVLSQLELAFPSEEGQNLISELFSCKYRQQMFVESADGVLTGQTPVESVFVHPIIGVEEEGKDLYDCLGELYLRGSEIEYEGKKGYIMDLMERFPPLLYIQMRRSQYDIATGRERKTNTHIPFDQTLAMDRFLASADPEKRETSIKLTRTMTDTRIKLHQLRDNKPLPIPGTFDHARQALQQIQEMPELEITPDFLGVLESEGKRVTEEIERLQTLLRETKNELDGVWREQREMEYELVAVFMHRGRTSGAGHYWTYQAHLPDHSDTFFKYNDETVTEVPASEVLQDRTGSDANPALLCYVRKDNNLVDTLHRAILEVPKEEGGGLLDEGVVMDDTVTELSVTLK